MRILVLKPILPRHDALGASEQDHLMNIRRLMALGHDVHLLTRANVRYTTDETRRFYAEREMNAEVLPHTRQKLAPARFRDAAFLDGASWEYALPDWFAALDRWLNTWSPDLVWSHGSYNWAGAARAYKRGVPTVIRSENYEPQQLVHERGLSGGNRVRYLGKLLSERRALSSANVLAAITPDEQAIYERISPTANVRLLPLSALPSLLKPPVQRADVLPLRVFFMGSTYNVPHNRAALDFVVREVVPRARADAPGAFAFHVLGSKVPPDVLAHAAPDLVFAGYVPDLDAHLDTMDIALIPSLFGHGMQQKVFEPLCRGLPTITHARALAGYSFEDDASVLLAGDAESYVRQLVRLRDAGLRERIGRNAFEQATALFNEAQMQGYVRGIIEAALLG